MAEKIYADIQTLEPKSEIHLYELDVSHLGGDIAYFHAHRQSAPIYWQGKAYHAFPVEATGFAVSGTEAQPTPELMVGDPEGGISTLCALYKDLARARFTRKRTLLRFLDAENFTAVKDRSAVVDPLTVTHVDLDDPMPEGPVVEVLSVDNIVLTDPLGSFELSYNSRQNMAQESHNFIIPSNGATGEYPYQTAPNGDPTTLIYGGNPMLFGARMRSNVLFTQAVRYTVSMYARPHSGQSPKLALTLPPLVFGAGKCVLSDSEGNATVSGEVKAFGVEKLPSGWYRLWVSDDASVTRSDANIQMLMDEAPGIADGWEIFGLQVEESDKPTKYITTNGAARHVVDYNTPVIKTIILNEPPMSGSSLSYNSTVRVMLGNPDADPNEAFPDDVFYISQKVEQVPGKYVRFQLKSALDLDGSYIPSRPVIKNVCGWAMIGGYRGPYCGYTGTAYFDKDDNPVPLREQDECSYRLKGCQVRFGTYNELPFGGFPGTTLTKG